MSGLSGLPRDSFRLRVDEFDPVDSTVRPEQFVEWMQRQRRGGADCGLYALGLGPRGIVLVLGCGPELMLLSYNTDVGSSSVSISPKRWQPSLTARYLTLRSWSPTPTGSPFDPRPSTRVGPAPC